MDNNFSILINTTDSFEDCWLPFFKLFKEFWPEFNGKIYLNTETKSFTYKDLNIISVKNGLAGMPWSLCLNAAVNKIEEKYFIYMQEDYFLHKRVKHKEVKYFFNKIKQYDLDCLHLTDQSTLGPFSESNCNENIWEIKKNAKYRISTQAAFWKKEKFKQLLRPWESGWDFEKFGTIRSKKLPFKIMTINHKHYRKNFNEIMPYIFTGIIKGKWKNEVPPLFDKYNIVIDYSLRGFVDDKLENGVYKKLITLKSMTLAYLKNFFMEIKFFLKHRN